MLRTSSGEFYLRKTSSGESNPGSPLSNAAIRQRHSQGYATNDEDLEDGVCLETPSSSMPITIRSHAWTDAFQNIIWIVSAAFIVYLGDCNMNLVSLMLWDERIKRMALYLGIVGGFLNLGLILHTVFSLKYSWTSCDKNEASPPTAPVVVLLGFFSFCSFSYALWPIWSFLTIPLVITLFMTFLVVSPYLLNVSRHPQYPVLRAD
ncbi:hypothetical protein J5N97_006266 [Dioscorea zingiberensis]|uniref:Transmembrane protein n=1 Tax=Dioscorea zingiberensis TaxID=325984 RepID=A0A9D5DBX5_9LILI|nr:hypothetical protein J5N97_006266 [Dioscorea zingiberensis]